MDVFVYTYIFIVGLVFGSFYNVAGLRLPEKQSLVKPRSRCPGCSRELTALDLVPVFSFLFLRGKCRGCGNRISPLYPAMELTTGLFFILSYYMFGFSWELGVSLLFVSLLVIITVSDLKYRLILDKVLLSFLVPLLLLRMTVAQLDPWWEAPAAGAAAFTVLLLLAVVSKGGMGGGDIKLYGVLGVVLGLQGVFISLFLAAFIGSIAGLIGMAARKWGRKTMVPFGPFIAAGSTASYFFGDRLIELYMTWLITLF